MRLSFIKIIKKYLSNKVIQKIQYILQQKRLKDFQDIRSNEKAFDKIYKEKFWGGQVLSGAGSDGAWLDFSIDVIKSNIINKNNKIILDIGCGGFYFGREIYSEFKNYIGLDVSKEIIKINKKKFPKISFIHDDAIKDPLPKCNVVIIRQVLQHLPNSMIDKLIQNVFRTGSKEIYVFEDIPHDPKYSANVDLEFPMPETRSAFNSGVDLGESPFNYKVIEVDKTQNNENRCLVCQRVVNVIYE